MVAEAGKRPGLMEVFRGDLGKLWKWLLARPEGFMVDVVRVDINDEQTQCGLVWEGRERVSLEEWRRYGWVLKKTALWPGRRLIVKGPDGKMVPVVGDVEDGCCTVEELRAFVDSEVVSWVAEIGVSKMDLLFNPLVIAVVIGVGGVIAGMLVPSLAEGIESFTNIGGGSEDGG